MWGVEPFSVVTEADTWTSASERVHWLSSLSRFSISEHVAVKYDAVWNVAAGSQGSLSETQAFYLFPGPYA
jgi:hypothetical protein